MYCQKRSVKSSHRGKIFGATLEARLRSSNVKKDVTVFPEGTYIYYFVLTEKKQIGEIFMKADSKKHETQKLVNIIKVVERSSRYLFYL